MIFERLDGSFGNIDMMVVGLNELEFDVSQIEVRFDHFCGLIVPDIPFLVCNPWILVIRSSSCMCLGC